MRCCGTTDLLIFNDETHSSQKQNHPKNESETGIRTVYKILKKPHLWYEWGQGGFFGVFLHPVNDKIGMKTDGLMDRLRLLFCIDGFLTDVWLTTILFSIQWL